MVAITNKPRSDGRFTPIPEAKVELMRKAKKDGYSLREISNVFSVAKSTVSYYCRDLFWHPNRLYETEEDAREAIILRGIGKDHNKYKPCIDCGMPIRNSNTRCLKCNLGYQKSSGELYDFITSGIPTRFKTNNQMAHQRKFMIMKFTKFNKGDKVTVLMPKGSGYERPINVTVIDKGKNGIVLLEKENGKRFYANSHRIKRMV